MATNPYVNKVVVNNQTLIDLTADTVDAAHLAEGYTAHDLTGAPIVGTMSGGGGGEIAITNGSVHSLKASISTVAPNMFVEKVLDGVEYVADISGGASTSLFSSIFDADFIRPQLAKLSEEAFISCGFNYTTGSIPTDVDIHGHHIINSDIKSRQILMPNSIPADSNTVLDNLSCCAIGNVVFVTVGSATELKLYVFKTKINGQYIDLDGSVVSHDISSVFGLSSSVICNATTIIPFSYSTKDGNYEVVVGAQAGNYGYFSVIQINTETLQFTKSIDYSSYIPYSAQRRYQYVKPNLQYVGDAQFYSLNNRVLNNGSGTIYAMRGSSNYNRTTHIVTPLLTANTNSYLYFPYGIDTRLSRFHVVPNERMYYCGAINSKFAVANSSLHELSAGTNSESIGDIHLLQTQTKMIAQDYWNATTINLIDTIMEKDRIIGIGNTYDTPWRQINYSVVDVRDPQNMSEVKSGYITDTYIEVQSYQLGCGGNGIDCGPYHLIPAMYANNEQLYPRIIVTKKVYGVIPATSQDRVDGVTTSECTTTTAGNVILFNE